MRKNENSKYEKKNGLFKGAHNNHTKMVAYSDMSLSEKQRNHEEKRFL